MIDISAVRSFAATFKCSATMLLYSQLGVMDYLLRDVERLLMDRHPVAVGPGHELLQPATEVVSYPVINIWLITGL